MENKTANPLIEILEKHNDDNNVDQLNNIDVVDMGDMDDEPSEMQKIFRSSGKETKKLAYLVLKTSQDRERSYNDDVGMYTLSFELAAARNFECPVTSMVVAYALYGMWDDVMSHVFDVLGITENHDLYEELPRLKAELFETPSEDEATKALNYLRDAVTSNLAIDEVTRRAILLVEARK